MASLGHARVRIQPARRMRERMGSPEINGDSAAAARPLVVLVQRRRVPWWCWCSGSVSPQLWCKVHDKFLIIAEGGQGVARPRLSRIAYPEKWATGYSKGGVTRRPGFQDGECATDSCGRATPCPPPKKGDVLLLQVGWHLASPLPNGGGRQRATRPARVTRRPFFGLFPSRLVRCSPPIPGVGDVVGS